MCALPSHFIRNAIKLVLHLHNYCCEHRCTWHGWFQRWLIVEGISVKADKTRKKTEAEHKWRNHKESQRRWCRAATCQTTAMYGKPQSSWNWKQRYLPASDKYYWLSSFSKHLCFLLSNFKLLTSSFTHHPCVTKACATLHAHVHTLTQLAMRGFWVNCT